MEKYNEFERNLFGDEIIEFDIYDVDFWVDRISEFPKIRPLSLDKNSAFLTISKKYCENPEFRLKLLKKYYFCPVLIFKLFKEGVYSIEDIKPIFQNDDSYIFCHYFKKEIGDFQNFIRKKPQPIISQPIPENDEAIEQLINTGFLPSSIEYCLKYDDIQNLKKIDVSIDYVLKWSPFEWSYQPENKVMSDLLSFSAFFGSILCFKHLSSNNYKINSTTIESAICGGSLDIINMCFKNASDDCIYYASYFYRESIVKFYLENGHDINAQKQRFG